MYAWLTPDADPDGAVCIRLVVPAGIEWEAIVRGALVPLFDSANFEQYGSYTPDETAAIYREAGGQWMQWESCLSVGSIIWTAGTVKPDNALWADGSEVLQADYPALYTALGTVWGTAATDYFKLPDLRARFPVGADPAGGGDYDLGDTGGERDHTLTTAEIPSHSHSVHTHAAGVIGELLLPCSTPSVVGGQTGSTGGGDSHENRPPFAALSAYIIAQ